MMSRMMLLSMRMIFLLTFLLLSGVGLCRADVISSSTIGMSKVVEDVILAGSELQVKKIEDESPVVLRIVGVHPHGNDMFRYDLEYYGLKPGEYNLVDFLERKDHSEVGQLEAVLVQVESILAEDRVEPNSPSSAEISNIGGYRTLLLVVAALWIAGALVILFYRKKTMGEDQYGEDVPVPTLAERLKPMVEQAISGDLNHSKMAELEMMLVAFWRKRLQLDEAEVSGVPQKLKEHEEAGPLLMELEALLHQPHPNHEVDVAQILKPYQNMPAEEMEEELAELSS